MRRHSIAIATLVALACASVSAQYLKYRDPKTPRNADGTPNMNALGVHKTAELVVYALQHGLVNPL